MLWYQLHKNQIANELETNLEAGLKLSEVQRRFLAFGPNQLPEQKSESYFVVFARQFKSPLIYLLLACAIVIYNLGETGDSIIILAVLLFNAVIGTIQEGRSARTLQSLKKLSVTEATLVRDGKEVVVPEAQVVPGDMVLLMEGQRVAADARVIFSSGLTVDESALTGESGGVQKNEASITEQNLPASGQMNMVFKGTQVVAGGGRAVVVATGLNTELGKISKALLEPQTEIPLQKNIRKLSQVIIYAVGVISVSLFGLGIAFGKSAPEMFAIVVSLAVSIIPEGLPLVLTLILATGVWRMSKRNALVKKLQAVEALGQANVLATDKTGTLTRNEMVIKELWIAGKLYRVSGNGYEPKGGVFFQDHLNNNVPDVQMSARVATLASRAAVLYIEDEKKYKVSGDPTEAAMVVFGEKLGLTPGVLGQELREVGEIPFSYKTKYRAVFYQTKSEIFCAVAGAPETLLKSATAIMENGHTRKLSPEDRHSIEQAQEAFSARGLRVLAVGFKNMDEKHPLDTIDGLTFGALFAIEDSLRPEAAQAVHRAHGAGLKVVMITGDHKTTAQAIAREAGIYTEGDTIVTGPELLAMSHEQLAAKLHKVSVFARVTPDDKMKIIQAYKHAGLTIAMTGDGVNDAPSLVAADLGVAMGKIGTEVAKEAADIVLLDDNLQSIVAAIEEGRAMHQNIQKALLFLFSTSMGELFTIVFALFGGLPLPILAVQILWLNLITDPLIGIALALTPKEPGLLEQKFSRLPKYFMTNTMFLQTLLISLVMAGGTLFLFDLYGSVSVSLTVLAAFQWFNGFNCASPNRTIFNRTTLTNVYLWLAIAGNAALQLFALHMPFMQKILKTTQLSGAEWVLVCIVALSVVAVEEIRKGIYFFFKRFSPKSITTRKKPAI